MGRLQRAADRTCGRKKKLEDAARAWATGGTSGVKEHREYEEDKKALAELGASEEEIEQALAARKPVEADAGAVEVWQENIDCVRIFCALGTQWHRAGMTGVRTGLIYSEAIGFMRERGLKRERRLELLGDLRAMERAAIEAWRLESEGGG